MTKMHDILLDELQELAQVPKAHGDMAESVMASETPSGPKVVATVDLDAWQDPAFLQKWSAQEYAYQCTVRYADSTGFVAALLGTGFELSSDVADSAASIVSDLRRLGRISGPEDYFCREVIDWFGAVREGFPHSAQVTAAIKYASDHGKHQLDKLMALGQESESPKMGCKDCSGRNRVVGLFFIIKQVRMFECTSKAAKNQKVWIFVQRIKLTFSLPFGLTLSF